MQLHNYTTHRMRAANSAVCVEWSGVFETLYLIFANQSKIHAWLHDVKALPSN